MHFLLPDPDSFIGSCRDKPKRERDFSAHLFFHQRKHLGNMFPGDIFPSSSKPSEQIVYDLLLQDHRAGTKRFLSDPHALSFVCHAVRFRFLCLCLKVRKDLGKLLRRLPDMRNRLRIHAV